MTKTINIELLDKDVTAGGNIMILIDDDNELLQRGNKYLLEKDFTLAMMSFQELINKLDENIEEEKEMKAAAYNNMGVAHFLLAEGGFKRAWKSQT